jgi:hypothetical protein
MSYSVGDCMSAANLSQPLAGDGAGRYVKGKN